MSLADPPAPSVRRRLGGGAAVLAYFVGLACCSQISVVFGGHSASPSVYFGQFTSNAALASPLIDSAEGTLRQALDYLGVGLVLHGHSPWWNPYSGLPRVLRRRMVALGLDRR
jgi:hypothetical protein